MAKLTVADLRDYLDAFDPDQQVVLTLEEAPEDQPERVVVLAFVFHQGS